MAAKESMPLEEPIASPQLSEKPTDTSNVISLKELEEMLVDIQISISNVLLDNRKTRNNLAELTTIVCEQKSEIASLKASLVKITKQCIDAERKLAAAKKCVNEQREEIYELYYLHDKLEQYTRKNLLEIHGVPESAYSMTEEVVLKLAQALEVPITAQDFKISHTLKRKGNKPIIVKLASHKIKSSIYKATAKLKIIKVSNLFLKATGATRTAGNHIYLYENLTSHGKKIVSRANELKRDGILLSV